MDFLPVIAVLTVLGVVLILSDRVWDWIYAACDRLADRWWRS